MVFLCFKEDTFFIATILTINETEICSNDIIFRLANHKSSILYYLATKFIKCPRTKMQKRINVMVGKYGLSQILKR